MYMQWPRCLATFHLKDGVLSNTPLVCFGGASHEGLQPVGGVQVCREGEGCGHTLGMLTGQHTLTRYVQTLSHNTHKHSVQLL